MAFECLCSIYSCTKYDSNIDLLMPTGEKIWQSKTPTIIEWLAFEVIGFHSWGLDRAH